MMSGAVSGSQFCAGGSPASDSIEPFRRMPSSGLQHPTGERPVLVLERDRDRLAGEVPAVPGGRGPAVALEGVLVHLLAADAPTGRPAPGPPGTAPTAGRRSARGTTAGTARCPRGRWRRAAPGSSTRPRRPPPGRSGRPSPRRRRSAWPAGRSRTGGRRWWPGRVWGRPAATQALRVTLVLCSPTWVTHPPMTSSTAGIDAGPLDAAWSGRTRAGRPDASWPAPLPACPSWSVRRRR